MSDRRIQTGRLGERAAIRYLERAGFRTVERNYRTRYGELDLIALRGGTLVFCEVKTLVSRPASSGGPTNPLESIRPAKRAQVRRIARAWLAERRAVNALPRYHELRFDAVGVLLAAAGDVLEVEHIEAAF